MKRSREAETLLKEKKDEMKDQELREKLQAQKKREEKYAEEKKIWMKCSKALPLSLSKNYIH
jgi:hypothetical protein